MSLRYRATKKSCVCGVSPGHAGRNAAFSREKCRYVGRDAAFF
jgi:hypothetical protein